MDKMKYCLLAALIGAAVMALSLFGVRSCTEKLTEPSIVRDTLIVHDTIRIEKPVAEYVVTRDTIRIPVPVTERDTIYVSLPREERTYTDSTFRAVVSGYEPSLDLIEVYPQTTTITETRTIRVPERKRWGIGVQIGGGAVLNGKQVALSPYIGVGVSYNLFTF